jgi:transcriptional regulator GlxA family with amidase domain
LRRIMLGGRPSVEKLAATLQMSARTLQRRLHEERTR